MLFTVSFFTVSYCRWSKIAESMPHRTDNDIKNRWNSKKKQERNRAKLMAAGGSQVGRVGKKTGKAAKKTGIRAAKQEKPLQPLEKQCVMSTQLNSIVPTFAFPKFFDSQRMNSTDS